MLQKFLLLVCLYGSISSPPCEGAPENLLNELTHSATAVVTVHAFQVTTTDQTMQPHMIMTPQGPRLITPQRAGVYERSGAGLVLDPNGIIVTNTHIIFGSQFIRVTLNDGTTVNATVLFVSPEYDFSLIKASAPQNLPAIEWADSDYLSLGQEIITIGHSDLLKNTISGGKITGQGSRLAENGKTIELIELNINHYPGDSGGPVFDRHGKFIGLLNAKRLNKNRACFAVPANKIHFAYLNLAEALEKK